MTARTETIASVLQRPRLLRPVLAHELRERLVQGMGAGTTEVEWTATVPQLAEAIDTELTRHEQKDSPTRPPVAVGSADTARAQILAALQAAGHSETAARELLARAFRDPHADPVAGHRPETLVGGHALVVEYGDQDVHGACQCGRRLGRITPTAHLDSLAALWERHTLTELAAQGSCS
ncbi:hypothetical protein ABZZ79_03435 [Streptomyces sp. NPDC006458]|uniref:hypothetical protein n=1 Tax=Streptomyces sp. NPDC006458 TaxID=3154302 RepID=UPI0033B62C2C